MRLNAFGRIAGIEIGNARTFRRLRQKLQHNSAGAPAVGGPSRSGAQFFCDCEAHPRRNLFGSEEIFMCHVLQGAAVEGDQPLIADHVGSLVDGHRKMALAKQRAAIRLA